MRTRKRGAEALARLSNAKERACTDGGETTVSSILDVEFNCRIEDIRSYLPKEVASVLQRSVVLLTLSNEMGLLSVSAGIAIECWGDGAKVFTTSALINPLYDKIEDPDNLKIEVQYQGVVLTGLLEEYDLDLNIAVVKVLFRLDVCCVPVNCEMDFPYHGKTIAVSGDDTSSTLLATTMALPDSSAEHLTEGGRGGMVLLFDFYGNFVGLNLGSCLLSRLQIRQLLQALRAKESSKGDKHYTHPDACRYIINKLQVRDGYCLGYPMPPRGDMVLVNTFEEAFGAWTAFGKTICSTIDRNIVSLASFKDNTQLFACTGIFIDFDEHNTIVLTSASLVRHPERPMEILEDLEIKVLLPNKKHKKGVLLHCSSHYNVALISVKDFRALRTVNLDYKTANISSFIASIGASPNKRVVAVGRSFQSGVLMAENGKRLCASGSLDCPLLLCSSCRITKVGIGGPLVDLHGNFIGMNFYDWHIGTPFLLREDLCGILKYFKTGETTYNRGFDVSTIVPDNIEKPFRWPVLKPQWCHPDCLKEDRRTSERERRIIERGGTYAYYGGRVVYLK